MSRVDFYILPDGDSVEQFACSISNKAWKSGNRVHIHTRDEQMMNMLDVMLWTFRDTSFLPHEIYDRAKQTETMITLGQSESFPANTDVVINMDETIPDYFKQLPRVVEIVGGSEERKHLARERYRSYRDADHELHNHHINDN